MPARETFTTARLTARRIDAGDRAFLVAMFGDPAVNRTLGGPRDDAQVDAVLDRMTGHWVEHGFGTWVVCDSVTGEPLGWVGLHTTDTGGPGRVELLYAVASDHWRRGVATEAGRAALTVATEDLGLRELVCFTLVDNVASQRTMAGLGFAGAEPVEHAGLPHVLMRLDLSREEVGRRG